MAFRCVTLLTSNLQFSISTIILMEMKNFNEKWEILIKNLLMKIHENFHVKGIFLHDKSNRMKVDTGILVFFSDL